MSQIPPISRQGSIPAVPDSVQFDPTEIERLSTELTDLLAGGTIKALFHEMFYENQSLRDQIACHAQLMQLLTHQLATPLTTLSGSVHLLAEPELQSEQRQEFLEVVEQQIHRLRDLLADLMALRNLETGTLGCQPVRFCLKDLVDEVWANFAPHRVTEQFSAEIADVWGDRWQVSQILVNLFSNAVKYSPNGQPVEVGATPISSDWIEVWVKDQGLGIPAAEQPYLFERFYRVKHPDRQHISGTGLGLSLCKLLVENQGGQMGLESTHGVGSRFYFTLPTGSFKYPRRN